jgi:hypothetical protein
VVSAAEESNAIVTAERWVAEAISDLCRILCVPAEKVDEIIRDCRGEFALDVVMASAAWELALLPEVRSD